MKNWYKNLKKGQKTFLYLVAIVMLPLGEGGLIIGVPVLLVLIYLELGNTGSDPK